MLEDNIVRPDVGTKWLSLFLNPYPELAEKTTEKLSKVRSSVSEKKIRDWFLEVSNNIEEQNLTEVLADPNRVYNFNETSFFLLPKV